MGLDPNPFFSVRHYLKNNPDVASAKSNPLSHYIEYGVHEGRKANLSLWGQIDGPELAADTVLHVRELFDVAHYRAQVHNLSHLSSNALISHYLIVGENVGLSPSAEFMAGNYLEANPDLRRAGVYPLLHYALYGRKEGRRIASYDAGEEVGIDEKEEQVEAGLHLLHVSDQDAVLKILPFFDAQFYRMRYSHLHGTDLELAMHFHRHGWKSGLNPNANFNTKLYISSNLHVSNSNINPLLHYAEYGSKVGRPTRRISNITMNNPQEGREACVSGALIARTVEVSSDFVDFAARSGSDLYVHGSEDCAEKGLYLSFKVGSVAMNPIGPFNSGSLPLPVRSAFLCMAHAQKFEEFLPGERSIEFGTRFFYNYLADYIISDFSTLQLCLGGFQTPRSIKVSRKSLVLSDGIAWTFEAYLSAWRCGALLSIHLDSGMGNDRKTLKVPIKMFSNDVSSDKKYELISFAIPRLTGDHRVSVEINYLGYKDDGTQLPPVICLANAKFCFDAEQRECESGDIEVIDDLSSKTWFHAKVPPVQRDDESTVTLSLFNSKIDLFEPIQNTVTLVDDYGHSLVLKAEKPQPIMLFIDGEPAMDAHVGVGATVLRLPTSSLRGEIVNVSIRDMSGSHVFLSLPVLAPRLLTPHDVLVRESRPPYPTDLTVRANHRYQALRAHLDHPTPGLDAQALATAFATLDLGYEMLKLKPIAFPAVDKPKVSVIIPAHNKVEVTYYGLCALLAAHNATSFEVILVDDASTDETAEIEQIVSGITVIRNAEPQRFIRACNAGVAAARGAYVVLLNNDTEPTVGWLDALCDAFDRFDNVGLVGSKLLYPDGKLQEAGGIIWGSGNPWNYGNRANPWEPRFCYARQADYLSGAAMMTPKAIWDEVGGLSDYLEPMYFEDTDFAFKVREAGYTTWFVPSSVVYHFEGMTSGTDVSTGFKSYQEVNRPKFKRRWARDYASFGREGHEPDLKKDRGIAGRVLFIDYTTPREDRDAGSYAAHREIELVQSLGYKVTFLPQNLAHFGSQTDELQNKGVEVITAPFYLSVAEFLEKRAAEFDAIYITRYYVAQDSIPHIRRANPKARIILNNADLHFLRELRAAISEDDPSRLAAMRRVRDEELEMMRNADLVLSYNEVEHAIIASHTEGKVRVMTCPWVVDIPAHVPPLKERKGLSFLGNFNHHPNAEGLLWFAAQVMPRLKGAHLSIYGAGMGPDIKALASDIIDPVGYVENVADAYDKHRIFIAPLRSGAGIKGKVLGAIAHGIPCVLSPVAAEGTGLRHGHDCLIAETPQDWSEAIAQLSQDDALWEAMSTAARSYAAARFSFTAGRAKMKAAFEAVDLFGVV